MPVECPICFIDFDTDQHVPYVGTCGHSVCATCRARLLRECPTCKTPHAFLAGKKNFQLIDSLNASLLAVRRAQSEHKCHNCKTGVLLESALLCISCLKEPKIEESQMLKFLLCRHCAAAGGGHGHQIKNAQEMLLISKSIGLRDSIDTALRTWHLTIDDKLYSDMNIEKYKDLSRSIGKLGSFKTIEDFNQVEQELKQITQGATKAYEAAVKSMMHAQDVIRKASLKTKALVEKSVFFTAEEREIFKIGARVVVPPTSTPSTSSGSAAQQTKRPVTPRPASSRIAVSLRPAKTTTSRIGSTRRPLANISTVNGS